MTIHLTKKQIRQVWLTERRKLSKHFILKSSQHIIKQIKTLPAYTYAMHVAWYLPMHGEVDLLDLCEGACQSGKYCYLPKILENHCLAFMPYTPKTKMSPNRYGILEPNLPLTEARSPADLDIIFVPVVAFDAQFTRLGMGGGFYDKTLQNCGHPLLIGVAYEWQKHPCLPLDAWDRPLDMIITEENIYSSTNIFFTP